MSAWWNPSAWNLIAVVPVALILTRVMIALARRYGWEVQPKADRWHQKPTALLGGVAIFGAFASGCLYILPVLLSGRRYDLLGLLIGAVLIFALGLRDDRKPLNPLVKLFGQVAFTMPFLVGMGLQYHASAVFIIGMPALFFWSLALTNALNLLDNMDGLSAGTATVSGSLLATYAFLNGAPLVGMLSVALVFSCLGFLWYNFRLRQTARIFMGDCGSMLLGYVLSGLAVIGVCPTAGDPVGVVAIPALLLAVPIFDTSFVIVMRRKERRPISQGGKDHTSHRLVYAGFSDKAAVVALWALGLAGGSLALLADMLEQPMFSLLALAGCAGGFAYLGVYLSQFRNQAVARAEAPLPKVLDAPRS